MYNLPRLNAAFSEFENLPWNRKPLNWTVADRCQSRCGYQNLPLLKGLVIKVKRKMKIGEWVGVTQQKNSVSILTAYILCLSLKKKKEKKEGLVEVPLPPARSNAY